MYTYYTLFSLSRGFLIYSLFIYHIGFVTMSNTFHVACHDLFLSGYCSATILFITYDLVQITIYRQLRHVCYNTRPIVAKNNENDLTSIRLFS